MDNDQQILSTPLLAREGQGGESPVIRLGKRNRLTVLRAVDFGLYLDAGEVGDVLLPQRYVPEGAKEGDVLDVFLYLDGEERLVATTEQPLVEVGQFALLEVSWVNEFGAFLNWGLMKDLFCPFREQRQKMQQGRKYLIYCYIDPVTYRIVASAKVDKFLSKERPAYSSGDEVEALIQQPTDIGLKAIVDGRFSGLLFRNEVFQPLHVGDRVRAFVKQVRPDGKIDLKLQRHFGKLASRTSRPSCSPSSSASPRATVRWATRATPRTSTTPSACRKRPSSAASATFTNSGSSPSTTTVFASPTRAVRPRSRTDVEGWKMHRSRTEFRLRTK